MISPEQDKESRIFFQRQWRRPLHRFGKMLIPIILSGMTVFTIFLGVLLLLFRSHEEQWMLIVDPQMGMVVFSLVSVLFGIIFSLIHYYWRQRRQSQFVPIFIQSDEGWKDYHE